MSKNESENRKNQDVEEAPFKRKSKKPYFNRKLVDEYDAEEI